MNMVSGDWAEVALKLGVAVVLGAAIGLDRELRHKSAGVRTIGLVTLGAALAVMTVSGTAGDLAAASRVLQGTLAGIGFLGAGVIMHHGRSIEGLTTAASIWTAAALGAACGLGAWQPVIIGSALVLLLLVVAGRIEKSISRPADEDSNVR
jgi:putative Mg2+ transporter-C (MgtC) family protein